MIAKMAGAKPKVAVIGAGPGGIAMGIQLAQGGYDFTIFERGERFGGTWRNNTYPGAACDVPSHFYSYSYALNPRWSKTFANQPEILAYLEKVAADNRLGDHLVARSRVTTLRWSDTERRWTLETEDGARHQFDAVVTAVGMLDVPNIPDIPGADGFRGRAFHSSKWDHTKSTAGERVASIGTGASAIQYVPEIAPDTAHLTVFQRTPIWVSPRYDEPFTAEQHELFERDPEEALKVRDAAFQAYESANFAASSTMTKELTEMASSYLQRKVRDPELRAKLTPTYPVGCKRPLQSRAWFPTFALPNVRLETSPIVEFTERGLRTADGAEYEVDTVIYGTGFHAADYLRSLDVHGTNGRRLRDDWPTLFGATTDRLRSVFLGDPTAPDTGIVELVQFEGALSGPPPPSAPAFGFFLVSLQRDVDVTLAGLAALGFDDGVRRIEMPAPGGKAVVMAVVTAPDGVRVELIGPPE